MPVVVFGLLCVALTIAQDALPGLPWFHQGSYVALLVAALALMWWLVRHHRAFKFAALGASIVALTGLASSLLAPDTQTIARGPGETVPLAEPAGRLQFPLTERASLKLSAPGAPEFIDAGGRQLVLDGRKYRGGYVFWIEPHRAAYIDATDARGNHVTMTQPENTSFLSPVLLFAQTTPIAGHTLPVDTFAIPPLGRTVKAVLFSSTDVAAMASLAGDPRPGVLFAVEDRNGRMLPGAIRFARDGTTVPVGGVVLKPSVGTFPQVVIASAPYLPLLAIGLLVFLAAVVAVFKNPSRSRTGTAPS